MATYKVILNGVQEGMEASRVAPQLALLCKIPVPGAMALLASPSMVIKRALNPEMAAEYKAVLQRVGCKAVIERETDADSRAASLVSRSGGEHNPFVLNAEDVQRRLGALAKGVKNTVVSVVGLAHRYAAQAGGRTKSAQALTGGPNRPITPGTRSTATGARGLAAAARGRKSFRTTALIIASAAVATVAMAGFLVFGRSSSGEPCPKEYDAAKWTDCVGEVSFPNGEKYSGGFKDGEPDGRGILTWPNGERYIGEWRNGQRNGQGRFFWPDGTKYVGEFRNDKKHGHGTMTFANGRKYVGEFKDGNAVGEQRLAPGTPSK